jgi:hypothetical protein
MLNHDLKTQYPRLRRSDCSISTAIADVNAPGQSQSRLPWFWGAQNGWTQDAATNNSLLKSDRLLECKYCSEIIISFAEICLLVYRVNWMRARAQLHRWEEEFPRTEKEMEWSTRYFMRQRDIWYHRLCSLRQQFPGFLGHEAYCEEMMFRWEEFGRLAEVQYRAVNPNFPIIWKPIVTV